MQIKSQIEVTVELAGTPLSGTTVLRMLSPFAEAKKCPDGRLGVPAARMPFSVFNNLLIEEGYIKKMKDIKTGELWYVLVRPETLLARIKDIRERLEAAECFEESVRDVPMGNVTLQVKTKTRPHTTISDGKITVSYGELRKVLDLCKQGKVMPEWLAAVDVNCFRLLTNMGMLKRYEKKDTSDYFYQVADMEQIQTMAQTLTWMELPAE